MARKICVALLLWQLGPLAQAQPQLQPLLQQAKLSFNQAYGSGEQADFLQAAALFDSAARLAPDNHEAHFLSGLSWFGAKGYARALAGFTRAHELDSAGGIEVYFYLGQCLMFESRYAEAAERFQRFLAFTNRPDQLTEPARTGLRKSRWAALAIRNRVRFEPQNLGETVNGPGEDYNAWTTATDSVLFFNSHRAGNLGGRNPRVFHEYGSDFYRSVLETNGLYESWTPARNLGPPLNTIAHEKEFWLSPDGRRLLFGLHPLEPSPGNYDCAIYEARFEPARGTFASPVPLGGGAASPSCDSWPSLSRDGRTLYFISNRPGGLGGYDIWLAERRDGAWGPARNAGPTLNTPGDEFDVFIHPDGQTLYFTSDYHDGFGGYDIFLSRRAADGRWQTPQNLGYPLNTPYDEFDFFVNASGTTGYINSDRLGGFGRQDLYAFAMDPRIRPRGVQTVAGQVRTQARQVVPARVLVLDLATRDTVDLSDIDPRTGDFLITLPVGRDYAAYVLPQAEGWLCESVHFSVADTVASRQLRLGLELLPLDSGQAVALNNVFFGVDKDSLTPASHLELERVAAFLKANPNLRVELAGHTDSDGAPLHNLELSQRRASVVMAHLAQLGVNPAQMRAQGYGSSQPRAPNTDARNKARNRRTQMVVLGRLP